ncbi:hypothetical protein LTR95_012679 [Oleoguttula sp. CCFEE 5521]
MAKPTPPDLAGLTLEDSSDEAEENLFSSPSTAPPTTKTHTPASASSSAQKSTQQQPRSTPKPPDPSREAALQAELDRVREVNAVISGVTASLRKARENMSTVNRTVDSASTLLATWTRILSQTEHNQRLILNPAWQGASQDLEDVGNEESRRQEERERAVEEERRRREDAERRREDEERRRAVQAEKGSVGRRGSVRGGPRGSVGTGRGYTGIGGQAGRGRVTPGVSRGGSGIGRGTVGGTRGRGRG